jgi:hypothetical protein
MSFSSPLGGLIGNTNLIHAHPLRGRERTGTRELVPTNSSREIGFELMHRQSREKGSVATGTGVAQRPRVTELSNSPELLLWGRSRWVPQLPAQADGEWDFLEKLIGTVKAPVDWASEHDHYLYGSPPRHEQ